MNRVILVSIALIIVYFILSQYEMYMAAQRYTRTDVGNRVTEPFMTCSPESFDECKKAKMPNLSRY